MYLLRNGKFLKLLVSTILRLIGVFEPPLFSIIYTTIYTICLMTAVFGSTIGLFNTHSKVGKLESFVCFYVNFEVNCTFIASILCRHQVKKLFHTIQSNPIYYHDIIEETAEIANSKIIWLISVHNVLATMLVSPPLLLLIFRSTFSASDMSAEIIPYWFACDDLKKDGILNTFCWKIETKRELTVKVLLQLVIVSMEYLAFVFCFMLYCVIIAEFCVHVKIFKSEVAKLTNYANSFFYEYKQVQNKILKNRMLIEHNERMNREFTNIIKYLQYLRHCIREMNSTFKYYNNVLITACFFGTIIVLLVVFNKSENNMLFKVMAVWIHGIISYILLCYFAQIVSDTNETVLNEISIIPWYNQCLEFRKTYLMLLGDTCIPTHIKIYDARVLNLSFILTTFKTAYSIFNMLLLKMGNEV